MTTFFKTYLRHAVLCVLAVIAITGCAGMASGGDIGTTVSVVSHYGDDIGIPEAYLNGGYIGSHGGWGGAVVAVCVAQAYVRAATSRRW